MKEYRYPFVSAVCFISQWKGGDRNDEGEIEVEIRRETQETKDLRVLSLRVFQLSLCAANYYVFDLEVSIVRKVLSWA